MYASEDIHIGTQEQLEKYLQLVFDQSSNKFRANFVMSFLSSTDFYNLIIRFVTDNSIQQHSVALNNILMYDYIQSRIMINNISVIRHLIDTQLSEDDTSAFQISSSFYN